MSATWQDDALSQHAVARVGVNRLPIPDMTSSRRSVGKTTSIVWRRLFVSVGHRMRQFVRVLSRVDSGATPRMRGTMTHLLLLLSHLRRTTACWVRYCVTRMPTSLSYFLPAYQHLNVLRPPFLVCWRFLQTCHVCFLATITSLIRTNALTT